LTIKTDVQIEILEYNSLLQSKTFDKDNKILTYHLISSSFQLLKELEANSSIQSNMISMELRK